MSKEEFLTELKKNLKYLKKQERASELSIYENKDNFKDLDPVEIANNIYKERNLNFIIRPQIKFLDALNIITEKIKTKDKDILINLGLFLLYLIFVLIIIRLPFIYVRDLTATMFNNYITGSIHTIYYLVFELLYALTTILIYIRLIKNKALDLKKEPTKKEPAK